jgi:hypothetical protein
MTCKHEVVQLCTTTLRVTDLLVDTINELSGTGVIFEGILIKDGFIDGRDISIDGSNLDGHILNISNPHSVTKEQLSLGILDTPTFINVISGEPTISTHLATKNYVDNIVGGIFGTNFEQLTNDVVMNNTNTVSVGGFLTHLSLTTSSLPIGIYEIKWMFDWTNDSSTRDILVKITIDTVPESLFRSAGTNSSGLDTDNFAINNSGNNQRLKESGFININFTSATTHDLKIEFTRSDTGVGFEPVSICCSKINIYRII